MGFHISPPVILFEIFVTFFSIIILNLQNNMIYKIQKNNQMQM